MTSSKRKVALSLAVAALTTGTLAACGGGGGAASGDDAGTFEYLGHTENTTIIDTLTTLSKDQCADAQEAGALKDSNQPGAQYDQQVQLLAGQDALPDMMMAAGNPALVKELIANDQLEDLAPHLEEAGVAEDILPAARSTIQALYGDDGLYALPTEFNIEGIWYNKQIFEENGIEVPGTWDELRQAVRDLDEAGVQPISTPGTDGWNITRYIGDYIFRSLGPDALQKVADGEASLTDPEYVEAAQEVADMGADGAFGKSPGSIDYNTSMNQFLTGDVAMYYMGSWALANYNDPEQNKIGAENIGFMPFPAVEGGAGSIDQVPSNVGVPVLFGSSKWDDSSGAWLECVAANYGDVALADSGVVTGFAVDEPPADLPPLTADVQELIASTEESVLWFEALFTPEATTVSQQNAAPLVTGQISPEDFMAKVQEANAQ